MEDLVGKTLTVYGYARRDIFGNEILFWEDSVELKSFKGEITTAWHPKYEATLTAIKLAPPEPPCPHDINHLIKSKKISGLDQYWICGYCEKKVEPTWKTVE